MAETMSSNSCRICMSSKMHHSSIFSNDLSRKITEIADVEVQEGDGLPPTICEDCEVDLDKCYKFRVQIQWADSKFRENLSVSEVVFEECQIKQEIAPMHPFMNEDNQDNEDDDDDRGPSDNDDDDYDMREEPEDKTENADKEGNQVTHPLDHVEIIENRTKQEIHMPLTDQNSQEEPLIVAQNMKSENEPTTDPLMHNEPQSMETDNILPGPSTSAPMVKGTQLNLNWQGNSTKSMSKIDSEYVMLQQPDHFLSGLTLPGSVKDKQTVVSSGRNLRSSANCSSCEMKNVRSISQPKPRPIITLVRKSKGGRKKAPPKKITNVEKEKESEAEPVQSKNSDDDDSKEAESPTNTPNFEEDDEVVDTDYEDNDEDSIDNTYCQMCDIKFLSPDLLQEHMEGEDFTCRRCTAGFHTHSQLESHFFTHPTYKCHMCKKQFYVRKDLETHKENSPSCNSSLECKVCHKKFWRQRSLTVHIHYHHKSQNVDYKCTVCSKSFKVREQLQYHLKIVHMAYEHLECRICHKLLLGPLKMKHHMKMVHIKDQELQYTFSCQVCSKVFKNELTLKKHQEIHENPILCELCGKSYHCRTTLLSHIKNEHTKVGTFICVPCNKSFTSEVKYNYHLKKAKAHTNKESVPHFCEVCGKTLLSSNALKRHMIIHTGEKPYKCEICGAAFNQKSSLATHDRVHTASYDKFRCNDCGMSFKWKQTFANHPKKCKRGQSSGETEELPDELETSNRFINTFTGFRVV